MEHRREQPTGVRFAQRSPHTARVQRVQGDGSQPVSRDIAVTNDRRPNGTGSDAEEGPLGQVSSATKPNTSYGGDTSPVRSDPSPVEKDSGPAENDQSPAQMTKVLQETTSA